MKRASSLRLTLCPMPPISTAILGLPSRGLPLRARRVLDRLDDVHVASAAAEVAGDRLPYLELARVRVRRDERGRRHHHSRRAEAALETVLLVEAFLHRVQLAILLETLDRRHGGLVGLHREEGARLHRPPVEQHGARTAVRGVAADVRAGHPEVLAEEVHE